MHRFKRQLPPHPKQASSLFIALDKFSTKDIKEWASYLNNIQKFHWDWHSDLVYQREKIAEQLKTTLATAAEKTFPFSRWQRVVKYKYALDPFSLTGSLIDPGGRFNVGDINSLVFPPFPALYIASDKNTAFQETLCQQTPPSAKISTLDLALTNPNSIASVSISGSIGSVINLRHPDSLADFVNLIKDFTIPKHLENTAKQLNLPPPELIRTIDKLSKALLASNWREWPMQFDVPYTSQIFGRLVMTAGIEGILYPSKYTSKDCLAIFPQNFDNSDSYIQLDDEPPPETRIRKLDAQNYRELVRSALDYLELKR